MASSSDKAPLVAESVEMVPMQEKVPGKEVATLEDTKTASRKKLCHCVTLFVAVAALTACVGVVIAGEGGGGGGGGGGGDDDDDAYYWNCDEDPGTRPRRRLSAPLHGLDLLGQKVPADGHVAAEGREPPLLRDELLEAMGTHPLLWTRHHGVNGAAFSFRAAPAFSPAARRKPSL